ncbi:outer membrane beta-barrel protein [Microvirga sp. STR05]|uniref:Outer membrane beta-barrel protein n=1 Tax=Hymenobacter duratus TaxID=2771356 RepID=A0ABR8JEC5_9BACT|nr:outer membrane beta-barrel protein [Hymenobacter duratus]MBD2715208.1 outer membrane beta-barrel protein [Hymenobacter duratus]MBR7950115.1 outer membrane beta-barrel protein [Microvirga sp. STR05]
MMPSLLLRPVSVQRQLPNNPVVQLVVLDSVVPRRPSRWALEVLAGPALAYRRLGADSANSTSQYERPAVAFAAQVQARYSLTPRLYLTGGVGYATYSTHLDLVLRQRQRDSAATTVDRAIRQRDVFRYFTLPVQVQYQLQRRGRLQYGVLGGVLLDVYAGGRTSGSTPCTCEQQQSWSSADSPYRRVGLSLSAGLDLRYALTPRLTLLAQPMGRYSVLSVSDSDKNSSPALPARHPFAVGLLTGFSFNLR